MSVHFKFKSEKEFGTVNFPGTTIRVIDLKKGIIEQKKLNKGQDMELVITDFQNNTVYEDDNQQLPKNTSVIVKRMPAKNNVGILARINAEQKASAPLHHYLVPAAEPTPALPSTDVDSQAAAGGAETVEDELEALQAIQQEAEDARNVRGGGNKTWTAGGGGFKGGAPGGVYAGSRGGGFGGRGPPTGGRGAGGAAMQPPPGGDHSVETPPQGYVCYRCGVPGHFIQNCPTNGNANHDKHMVKPRTGIPSSLIKSVEGPNQAPGFTVVNTGPNGGLAIVVPQVKAFEKLVKSSGGGSGLDQYRLVPPDHLACPICKRLMQDAVLIPCCHESACDGCIRDALISHNLTCPLCRKSMSPENLIPNKGTRASVEEFLKRSQGEAQERERLVKEAEAKALQKQLAADDTETAQRRVEIADAVLDISKKSKADDDDDDLGGDLFADEPENDAAPVKDETIPPQQKPAQSSTEPSNETAMLSPSNEPTTSSSSGKGVEVKAEDKQPDGRDKKPRRSSSAGRHHRHGPPPGWRPHGGPPPDWFDGPPRGPWFDGPPPPWAAGGHFGHPPPHMYYEGGYFGGGNPPPWMRPHPGYRGGPRGRSAERKGDKAGDDKAPRRGSRSRERRRSSRDRKSSRYPSRSRSRRRDRSTERESSRKSTPRDKKSDDKQPASEASRDDNVDGRSSRNDSEKKSKKGESSRRGSEKRADDGDRSGSAADKKPKEKSGGNEKAAKDVSKPVEAPAIDLDFLEDDLTTEDKPMNASKKEDTTSDVARRKASDDRRGARDDKQRSDRHDRHTSDRKGDTYRRRDSDRKSDRTDDRKTERTDDRKATDDRKTERTDDRKGGGKGDDRRRGDKKADKEDEKKRSSERPSSRDDKRGDGKRRRSRSRGRASERKEVKKAEVVPEEPPKKKRSVFERLGPAVKK
ncbi:hypothetical protein H257_06470 [Aphanomyces astaci]|uniref:E3 ubiquitin-protein ligase RBBP6 n=3 Tax=Aphanomyces astaci TaxID=112090 RepID=W4GM40_APHAT|nr:hypothetical protein H257_06470 [Aphanomyces astaci]ETV80069.1 hypothetical protein H257_06470 [Aphanomyces astaci]|eukprot:XP_009829993.1 hypothetical protein H257_06470 [Aphanomyces astaci]